MSADELNEAVRANYAEQAAGCRESATRWLPHVMRNDSLGETARRKYLHCLHRAWTAEAIAEDAR